MGKARRLVISSFIAAAVTVLGAPGCAAPSDDGAEELEEIVQEQARRGGASKACTAARRPPMHDASALRDWFKQCGFSEAATLLGARKRYDAYVAKELSPHLGTASMAFVGVAVLDSPVPGPADATALLIVGIPVAAVTVYVAVQAAARVLAEDARRVEALFAGAVATLGEATRAEAQRELDAQARTALVNAGLRAMPDVKRTLARTTLPAACAALVDWEDAAGGSHFDAFGPGTAPGGANPTSCRAACSSAMIMACEAARARGMKHLIGWGKVPAAGCDAMLGPNELSGVGVPIDCRRL